MFGCCAPWDSLKEKQNGIKATKGLLFVPHLERRERSKCSAVREREVCEWTIPRAVCEFGVHMFVSTWECVYGLFYKPLKDQTAPSVCFCALKESISDRWQHGVRPRALPSECEAGRWWMSQTAASSSVLTHTDVLLSDFRLRLQLFPHVLTKSISYHNDYMCFIERTCN